MAPRSGDGDAEGEPPDGEPDVDGESVADGEPVEDELAVDPLDEPVLDEVGDCDGDVVGDDDGELDGDVDPEEDPDGHGEAGDVLDVDDGVGLAEDVGFFDGADEECDGAGKLLPGRNGITDVGVRECERDGCELPPPGVVAVGDATPGGASP